MSQDDPALSRGIPRPDPVALASVYALGRPLAAMVPLSGGNTNAAWMLRTTRGQFAVKGVAPGGAGWAPIAAEVEQHAIDGGVVTTHPLRTVDGRFVSQVPSIDGGESTVRVHSWVSGTPIDARSPSILMSVGSALGASHRVARPATDPIGSWQSEGVTTAEWRDLTRRAALAGAPWAQQLAVAQEWLIRERPWVEAVKRPVQRFLSHADMTPANAIKVGTRATVIDWDVGPLTHNEELAMVAAAWLFRGPGEQPLAADFLIDGYVRAYGERPRLKPSDFGPFLSGQHRWIQQNADVALGAPGKFTPEQAAAIVTSTLARCPRPADIERLCAAINSPVLRRSPETPQRRLGHETRLPGTGRGL